MFKSVKYLVYLLFTNGFPTSKKLDAVSNFMFNPNMLQYQYYEEKEFQDKIKRGWKKIETQKFHNHL